MHSHIGNYAHENVVGGVNGIYNRVIYRRRKLGVTASANWLQDRRKHEDWLECMSISQWAQNIEKSSLPH